MKYLVSTLAVAAVSFSASIFELPGTTAEAQIVQPTFPFYCNPPRPCETPLERQNEFNRQYNELCSQPIPGSGDCVLSGPVRGRITAPGEPGDPEEEYDFTPCPNACTIPPPSPANPGNRVGGGSGAGSGGSADEIGG
jgi:hypothetical protein